MRIRKYDGQSGTSSSYEIFASLRASTCNFLTPPQPTLKKQNSGRTSPRKSPCPSGKNALPLEVHQRARLGSRRSPASGGSPVGGNLRSTVGVRTCVLAQRSRPESRR